MYDSPSEDLPDKLRKILMHKRYLIVLDDIWDVEAWEELQLSFPDDENGSRALLTTRDEEVYRQLKHHSDPYFLRFLTVDESWDLLQKKVFQGEICPPELLKTGLQVAENCKGLPLVIVLIAGIIAKQREASLWLGFAEDLSSHILQEQSMKIIESSYDHLEDHLKSCLLYMGLFPEDHQFPVFNLLKLWIAENFVHNLDAENVEDASKICLNDLVNRSLVIVSRRREDNGEIEYCTVHDVVHEFCLRRLTKKKFMQYQPSKEPQYTRFIHDHLVHQLLQYTESSYRIPMLAGLKKGESLAKCHDRCLFGKTLLDYSSASSNLLEVVGSSDFSRRFETSPSIWKMKKLRHVDIQDFSFKWEDNDRALSEESSSTLLPELKTFGKCRIFLADKTPEFWWRFPHIEQLKLHFIEQGYEVHMPNLEELPLQSLKLCFSRPISGYKSIGLASCVVLPSNLKNLSLDRLCLTEEAFSQLASLRNLESLKLRNYTSNQKVDLGRLDMAYVGMSVIMSSYFVDIPTLKLIKLICCNNSLEDSAFNVKNEVEEIAGCDSLQVHIQYQPDRYADADFAAECFSVWDQENNRSSLTPFDL
uniref:Uncharacterized protein n=1 Tax=Solanum lycopersicum TaxID=4081 RepID=A0A3Q7I950_SOLLC